MPFSRNSSARMAQKSRRETGSTPVVGSSRTMSSGSWIRVQMRPSFCFMPPERCFIGRPVKRSSRVMASSFALRAASSLAGTPRRRAKKSMFSSTGSSG